MSLAENFNKSSLAREFTLRRSLQLLNSKGKTLATYSREFKTMCDSLSSIGKPVDESMKIFGYLNGLGREYDPITTVIQSSLTKSLSLPSMMWSQRFRHLSASFGRMKRTPLLPHTLRLMLRPLSQIKRTLTLLQVTIRTIEVVGDIPTEAEEATLHVVEGLFNIRRQSTIQENDLLVRSVGE